MARRRYARKLEAARKEKVRVEALLRAAEQASLAEAARLQQLQRHDQSRPKGTWSWPPPLLCPPLLQPCPKVRGAFSVTVSLRPKQARNPVAATLLPYAQWRYVILLESPFPCDRRLLQPFEVKLNYL